jgi:hypothetical protein
MSAVAIESSISLHHPHTAERSLNIEEALGMIVWLASVGLQAKIEEGCKVSDRARCNIEKPYTFGATRKEGFAVASSVAGGPGDSRGPC